jgi:putative spermidine/putrescine transport system substrate-binding protein
MPAGDRRARFSVLDDASRRGGANPISRRGVLAAAPVLGLGFGLAGCGPGGRAEDRGPSLRISTYGGFFEQGFAAHIYPEFTRATGIKVVSIAQAAGLTFLMQLIQANRAGIAPLDLCLNSPLDVLRGRSAGIWRSFDRKRLRNLVNLPDAFIAHGPAGMDAVGALGWYVTFACDPTRLRPLPTSWALLWDPAYKGAWGLNGGASYLFEITAATWFGGGEILRTRAGIHAVTRKIAELAPNVKLWWESEGVMQTALENQDVLGGTYFNDVAKVLAAGGTPVASVFPREGGVIDFGSWCQPSSSRRTAEADAFIDFMASPKAQAIVAREIGAVPLIRRELMDLTPAEFAAVSSEIPPIHVDLTMRATQLAYLSSEFNSLVLG